MSRWLSPLLAFCMSLMLITSLAPVFGFQIDRQFDFWLLWLLVVVVVSLPLTYLEYALVKRAKTSILNALMALTREADASLQWRIIGWLSVLFIPCLAGAMLSNSYSLVSQFVPLSIRTEFVFLVLAIVAVVLSFVPRVWLAGISMVAVLISLVSSYMFGHEPLAWHNTPIVFSEWGSATVLALVASGLGLGIYAQTSIQQVITTERSSQLVIPVWLAQVLAVVVFGFFTIRAQIPALTLLVAVVFAAAWLLQLAKQQLIERKLHLIAVYMMLLGPLLVWVIPHVHGVFNLVLMLWGLVSCLLYSLFAGWMMKISHLRKVLNFSNEIYYNAWRIAVRIVAPVSIIVAIFSLLLGRF
ncbi:hypothetical protein [Acinetobacter boissieri]|uniref:Uncharacterized protein n=1 Tax=Acinetobacter boissieri TaxID=1219383 RepID=A0A1G6HD51_9GAMM|nr:hypothetical protein [Acinetobacter boissieri]SDB92212.1 hypothetical protein SAMN05421733_10545 [Acinetobacter boissieri]